MTNIKQLILTLVALFAMTTGAWAQTIAIIGTMCPPDESTTTYNESTWKWVQCNPTVTGNYIDVKVVAGALTAEGITPTATQLVNAFKACNLIIFGEQGKVSTVQLLNASDEIVNELTVNKALDWSNRITIEPTQGLITGLATDYTIRINLSEHSLPLTPDATRKIWTLAEMPGGNVELIPEYYPGMLTFGNAIEGGKLEVVGIDLVTTSFTPPSGWHQNSTQLASSHFEGFKGVTEEEAKAWSGVPATGKVALYYNYDETEQKWDMIYFEDGAISQNHKEQSQQLATIYNLPTFNFSVFYTTGMQMPAGFERDEEGNYYVEAGTEFQVKGVPAEGFHLVSVTDGTNDIEVDADGIATITMPDEYADLTLTATFSDKYTVTLNAEGLSDEEAANWKAATGDNEPAAFPLENVSAGTEVKVTYTGTKKVLGVKAEKKAAGKPVATLIAAPTPYGYICVYDDIFETLGTAEGGTLMYKVTTTNVKPTSTEGFSTSNPKGVENSGGNWKNYIWYYIKGDDSHSDSEIFGPIEVNVWLM